MAPRLCLALLGLLLPHDNARAWSFSTGGSGGGGGIRYRSNSRQQHLNNKNDNNSKQRMMTTTMMMMAKDGDLVRVSLPKPLGIQLEEITPGAPGVRVAGVVEGGTAKENGVRLLRVLES